MLIFFGRLLDHEAPRSVTEDGEHKRYANTILRTMASSILKPSNSFPNPLALLDRREVLEEVEQFVNDKGLNKFMRLFKTAALVAHHPMDFESLNVLITTYPTDFDSVRILEEEELEALRYEKTRRFRHPRELYWTVVVCSIGAAVQ